MSDDSHDARVETLFDEAVGLPAAQREAFLRACGADEATLERVRTLLRHDEQAGEHFLEGGARPHAPTSARDMLAAASAPPTMIGTRVGPYTLVGVLGQGGMGTVYEAEQDHPRRKVALKLIRPGLMTPPILRRFTYEADLLGRLEHPGVARIYHAGVVDTPLGKQPFFAMELVRGVPLNQWAKEKSPPLKKRLELLIAICQAVHHAHTKGVIHRDLKPSNILVANDGQAKVLDFGVARATDSDVAATTLHTAPGEVVGTLPYMAPEQAAGKVNDVDTSSDVYALGVIAFELLSGKMPYEVKGKPIHEAVSVICESEPTRLSGIDRSLRGDVETIVLKALEKDRTRRYPTAGELAADVKRHLDYEPITARPPSTWYQLRKFAGRNKLLVTGVAVVVFVLAGGVVTSTVFAVRAKRQTAEALVQQRRAEEQTAIAEAVNDFQSQMLSAADPDRMLGDKVTVLQATNEAVKKLDEGALKDQPLVEAGVRSTIGSTLRQLGRYEEAYSNLRMALDLRRKALPADHSDVLESLTELAIVRNRQGRFEEAESLYREVLATCRKTKPAGDRAIGDSAHNLAGTLLTQGRFDEAAPLEREALEIYCKALPPGHPDIAESLNHLAKLLAARGKLAEAEQRRREALEIYRKALPAGHPAIARATWQLAVVLHDQRKLNEAEPVYREALAAHRKAFPAGHPEIAHPIYSLAVLLSEQRKFDEAEPLYREALAIYRKVYPTGHADLARPTYGLAVLLHTQNKLDEAEPLFREALAIYRKAFPAGHRDIATVLTALAGLVQTRGKFTEAEPLLREALEIRRKAFPVGHADIADAVNRLASLLRSDGKPLEAEQVYRQELDVRRKALGADDKGVAQVLSDLANLLQSQGKHAEAADAARECLGIRQRALPLGDAAIADAKSLLGAILTDQGNFEEAEKLLLEAYAELSPQGEQTASAGRARAAARIVMLYDAWGKPESAANWCNPDALDGLNGQAWGLRRDGKLQEAVALRRRVVERAEHILPRDDPRRIKYHMDYADLLEQTGGREVAEAQYLAAYESAKGALPARAADAISAASRLHKLYLKWLKPAEAEKWAAEVARLRDTTRPASVPTADPAAATQPTSKPVTPPVTRR